MSDDGVVAEKRSRGRPSKPVDVKDYKYNNMKTLLINIVYFIGK